MATNNLDNAGFFTPAANTKPYLKVAAQGFAGSGKTFTLAQIAKELTLQRRKLDPASPLRVAMVDTEKASGFLRRVFDGAGIEFMVKESRSLTDVLQAIALCESGYAPVLLIDSLSHIWEGFVEAYKVERKRTRLEMLDWGTLKPTWKSKFSDPFVRSRVDIFFTGRAGYEYDSTETVDERTGKKRLEIHKSGVKMKVEGETAYEPDLILHMERFEELLEDDKKVYRQCTVLKDRSGLLDGKTLNNPTGIEFLPVIEYLLTNAILAGSEVEGDDRSLFRDDEATDKRKLDRTIVVEKIEETIRSAAPGQTGPEKALRQVLLKECLGTISWTEVSARMPLERLREGLACIERRIVELGKAKHAADAEGKPFDPNTPSPAAPAAHSKKENGAKDGAEVAVVKPLSDVERERMVRGISQKMYAAMQQDEAVRWLTDMTGRAVTKLAELTDDELRRAHADLNQKAGV
jgi:hypothetical protein